MQRLLVLLLLACCLAPAFAAKVAILIGCNAYLHFDSLKSCITDVQSMRDALQAAGFEVHSMTGEETDAAGRHDVAFTPLKGFIENELGVWAPARAYGAGDTLLFFFSGHGVRSPEGLDYLAPLDGNFTRADAAGNADVDYATLLPMHTVYEQLRVSGAENLFIITDACRNEPGKLISHAGAFGQGAARDITEMKLLEQRIVLLRSCAEDQRSYEMPNGAGGYFTHYLTRGLSGEAAQDGKVTAASLCAYVKEQVRVNVAVAENHAQVPQSTFTNADPAAIVLADHLPEPKPVPPTTPLTLKILTPEALARGEELLCTGPQVTITGYVSGAPGVSLQYRDWSVPLGAVEHDPSAMRPFTLTIPGFQPGNYYETQLVLRDAAGRKVSTTLHFRYPPKSKPEPQPVKPEPDQRKINLKDGAEMILIPAGEFLMGSTREQANAWLLAHPDEPEDWFTRENPQHTVYLDAYYIYKNDVTVAQYQKFCAATGHALPQPPQWGWHENHLIVNVTWDDAKAYANWAGASLPTEAQWEKAARGGDGRIFPWGNAWDGGKCNNSYGTSQVGSFAAGASPYGVLDMAGNVWQWCADWCDVNFYRNSPARNPQGPDTGKARVVRGGGWNSSVVPGAFRAACRGWVEPTGRGDGGGFRCACVVPGR